MPGFSREPTTLHSASRSSSTTRSHIPGNPPLSRRNSTRAAATPSAVPRLILQYGRARTGTTLQFQTLCAIAHLIFGARSNTVRCVSTGTTKPIPTDYAVPAGTVVVQKTHQAPPTRVSQPAWLFATESSAAPLSSTLLRAHSEASSLPLRFVQQSADLARRGHTLAAEYQRVFRLSDAQTDSLLEYLKYWDVLRLCCGAQMSEGYRAVLQHRAAFAGAFDGGAAGGGSSGGSGGGHVCEMYKLDQVESLLLRTSLYIRFASRDATLRRASSLDGDFDGGYCGRANARIVAERLGQNNVPLTQLQAARAGRHRD